MPLMSCRISSSCSASVSARSELPVYARITAYIVTASFRLVGPGSVGVSHDRAPRIPGANDSKVNWVPIGSDPRVRRPSERADCLHEPRESPLQSRPGLGEMTNEEVGGSTRYRVGVDAEEPVIGSFDPLPP